MEAGRQLNAKVAEALGYEIISGEIDNVNPLYSNGHRLKDMDFSGSWYWMGILVEQAKEQGIFLEFEHAKDKRYMGRAWTICEDSDDWLCMPREKVDRPPIGLTAPHAVSLAYLSAKGIAV